MLLIRYLLLLLMLTCGLINTNNRHELSFLSYNHGQRIKRFLFDKSSSDTLLKNNQRNKALNDDDLFFPNNKKKQSQTDTRKGYTQQDLAEITRILSKKEDDYYGILNIKKDATLEKIVSAHRKLTLRVHPDKINAPGATEATQKLNRAREELLKRFDKQNQEAPNQQTTKAFTARSSTLEETESQQVPNDRGKSNSITTISSSVSRKKIQSPRNNSFHKTYSYLALAFIVLIIGIIIFIIYWKKRENHSHPSANRKISRKPKIPPIYDSPESNDNDVRSTNRYSELSIVQDEE